MKKAIVIIGLTVFTFSKFTSVVVASTAKGNISISDDKDKKKSKDSNSNCAKKAGKCCASAHGTTSETKSHCSEQTKTTDKLNNTDKGKETLVEPKK